MATPNDLTTPLKTISLTSDEHRDDAEDLLLVGVGRDVAESDGGEERAREVERREVALRERQH